MKILIAASQQRYDFVADALKKKGLEILLISTKEQLMPAVIETPRPDYLFFLHWSWKIPAEIFTRFECVVFHMTDLPYGRGGSPLQNLIMRGHKHTMLSALRCEEKLDAGPVYLKRQLELDGTAEEILRRAAALMPEMILEIVEKRVQPVEQQGEAVPFVRRRPEDGNLADLDDPAKAFDTIRMLDGVGYPPAFLETEGLRLEFTNAVDQSDHVQASVRITRKIAS